MDDPKPLQRFPWSWPSQNEAHRDFGEIAGETILQIIEDLNNAHARIDELQQLMGKVVGLISKIAEMTKP